MKKSTIQLAAKSLAFLFVLFAAFNSVAQENKIWTRVSNFAALEINTASSNLVSSNATVNRLLEQYNITSFSKAVPSSKSPVLQDLYEIECACNAHDLLKAISLAPELFIQPEIGPNYQVLVDPNDISMAFSYDYALHLIKAPGAWELTQGNPAIVIGISDAGYVYNHPELVNQVKFISPNVVQSNTAHGTAVAIAAAGATNNGYGKSSVGYNSSIELRGMNYNELLEASYNGVRIVNASWAASCFYSEYAQQIINEIHTNGTVIVASAGNGSTCGGPSNYVYPAAYNNVIAVSSVGPSDNHERTIGNPTTTHQHNDKVDICAPGYDVALSTSTNVFSTGNGTSFAAPMVSGAIALMLAVNPCLTPDNVEFILKASADSMSNFMNPTYAGLLGSGRLDVESAVNMAMRFNTLSGDLNLQTVCEFNEQFLEVSSLSGLAPHNIQWSNGDNGMIGLVGNPGTYSVMVTDSLGCRFYGEMEVETYAPISIEADLTHVSCFGQNDGGINVSVTNGSGAYNLSWSNGNEDMQMSQLSSGFYHLTVEDEFGCSKTESFEITSPEQLTVDLAIVHPNEFELGAVEIFVNGGTPNYSFVWSNGMNTEQLLGLSAGIYQVTVSDANGCSVSKLALLQQESVAGVQDLNDGSYTVYPNPANESVTIQFTNSELHDVYLYNNSGQLIETRMDQNGMMALNVSQLSNGIYHVELRNKSGNTHRTRVVVQH
jgi:hypothetical protein